MAKVEAALALAADRGAPARRARRAHRRGRRAAVAAAAALQRRARAARRRWRTAGGACRRRWTKRRRARCSIGSGRERFVDRVLLAWARSPATRATIRHGARSRRCRSAGPRRCFRSRPPISSRAACAKGPALGAALRAAEEAWIAARISGRDRRALGERSPMRRRRELFGRLQHDALPRAPSRIAGGEQSVGAAPGALDLARVKSSGEAALQRPDQHFARPRRNGRRVTP